MSQLNFPNKPTSTSSNSIANDKLKKAIERNRLRQAKRDGRPTQLKSNNSSANQGKQQEFFFNSQQSPRSTMPTRPATRMANAPASNTPLSASNSQRVSVATPSTETQFVRPTRTQSSARKSTIKYPVKKTSTTKRKRAKTTKARNEWVMRGAWLFLAVIFVRLVFAERGVLDYFSMKDLIDHKLNLIEQTRVDNKEIVKEMDLIRNSARYQKKIVREKLGFISQDEYLVIFSGESAPKSN